MSKKYLIGGNWKCNGSRESNEALVKTLNEGGEFSPLAQVVVSPAALHIDYVKANLRDDIKVAAQNIGLNKGSGAFTGDISADMCADFGLEWVIAGHSERRALQAETNEHVGTKTKVAIEAGLSVIVCIGEQLSDRESGNTEDVIFAQLQAVADQIAADQWDKVVIAYEPVWAIGTGVTATPEMAQDTHVAIRGWLKDTVSAEVATATRIIYGGSVKGANCESLVAQPDIDGFLVGGASLKADFLNIIKCVPAES